MSQKHECPGCGKRTFVKYVDEYDTPLHAACGRCDSEDSCRYHLTPKMYFADHPESRKEWKPQPRPAKKELCKPVDYINMDKYILPAAGKGNGLTKCHFSDFLYRTFPDKDVNSALWKFFVGAARDGAVIFPYIDAGGNARTAKIMKYDPDTGKRKKDVPNAINWVHSVLKKRGELPESFNMQLCLFGELQLQLSKNTNKPVLIVEGEKTAVIASILMPQFIWMAAGALGWLNIEKLSPLKERDIVLYPDTSEQSTAFEKWSKIAADAKVKGYRISVSGLLETKCSTKQKEQGYDIADYLMSNMNK